MTTQPPKAVLASPRVTPHIRPADEADMPAIQAIYAHHVLQGRATFEELVPSVAEMVARRADIVSRGLPYLVAECAGTVVGYAYATAYRPRRAYRFTLEDSIYLAPGWPGRGIGHALLVSLIATCEAGPWRQMMAVVAYPRDGAGAASLALHEKLGFSRIGTLSAVGFKFGEWIDTILMQRELGEGCGSIPGDV